MDITIDHIYEISEETINNIFQIALNYLLN